MASKNKLIFCPLSGGKISNEKRVLPLAFSMCSVTFMIVYFVVYFYRRKLDIFEIFLVLVQKKTTF